MKSRTMSCITTLTKVLLFLRKPIISNADIVVNTAAGIVLMVSGKDLVPEKSNVLSKRVRISNVRFWNSELPGDRLAVIVEQQPAG